MASSVPNIKIERRIAAAVVRSPALLGKVMSAGVSPEDFDTEIYRWIFREAVDYHNDERHGGKVITPFILSNKLARTKMTREGKEIALQKVEKLARVSDQDCEWVVEQLESFAKKKAFKDALEKITETAGKDIEEAMALFNTVKIEDLGRKSEVEISDIIADWERIQDRRREMRKRIDSGKLVFLKTGLPTVDNLINGGDGIFGGELMLVGAKTRRGKSNFSISTGVHNLLRNMNLAHVGAEDPIEMIEDRYHSCLLNIPNQDIRRYAMTKEQRKLASRIIDKVRKDLHGRLKIIACPPNSVTILEIAEELKKLKRDEKWEPDAMIFDPIDFFKTVTKHDRRLQQIALILEFRAFIISTMKPTFATTFLKAIAGDKRATAEDIGETYEKTKLATYFITMNQSFRQAADNQCTLNLDKNKNGPSFRLIDCKTDWAYSSIEEDPIIEEAA